MIDEKKLISAFAENGLYLPEVVERLIKSQPQIGGWIPCSEPPKHDKEVLIFNGKSYSVGYYDGKAWVNAIHPVEWQEIQRE